MKKHAAPWVAALTAAAIAGVYAQDESEESAAPAGAEEKAAESEGPDATAQVKAALEKLGAAGSYAWVAESTFGENSDRVFRAEGKVSKSGLIHYATSFGDNQIEMVKMGERGAILGQDGWRSLAEIQAEREQGQGQGGGGRRGGGFGARMLERLVGPVAQATELAGKTTGFKVAEDGGITGELTREAVAELSTFGRRRGGDAPPEPVDANGTVTYWIDGGKLAKFEVWTWTVMEFNGQEREFERATLTTLDGVGSTEFSIPAEAVAKLAAP